MGRQRRAQGDRRATVTFDITVANLRPGTATGMFLFALTPDRFNPVSPKCSDPSFCSDPGGELPAGHSITATVVDVACCFPKGERRTTSAGATVFSPTTDPDPEDNVASVQTKIVGPHGFSFPGEWAPSAPQETWLRGRDSNSQPTD